MSEGSIHPALQALEPARLWACFDAIRRIPRRSTEEEGVRRYLESLAESNGWRSQRDDAGNLVLYVPGRGAGVRSAPLGIQGHMDMVCNKRPGVEHDFGRDPIELRRTTMVIDGKTRPVLQADGTTLGSDNGIGISAGLALALDPSVQHPPLELVFTADEELGMTGAEGFDTSLLTARRLLNLDAEEHGSIYLGCAGGRDIVAAWSLDRQDLMPDEIPVRVGVDGLFGGHSGVDIHLGRGNGIKLLVRALFDDRVELDGVRLGRIDGGSSDNAIPRRATALLWCAQRRAERLGEQLMQVGLDLARSLGEQDAHFRLEYEIGSASERETLAAFSPLSGAMGRAILRAIKALPDGVLAMSDVIDGLVETSSNLGIVETTSGEVRLVALGRSSKRGVIASLQTRMEGSLEAAGATITFENGYPGWEADLESPLVEQAIETYESMFGNPPEVKAIHGGLECGYLAEHVPELKMIAFGPEIINAHTPDEALILDTVAPFWHFVTQLVRDLC